MRKVGSFLCLLVAVAAVIFMFLAKDAKGYRVFYGLFSVVEDGTFMSFIGNIFGVLLTVVGFGMVGLYGLSKDDKKALIGSAAMCGLCLLSFIIMLFKTDNHRRFSYHRSPCHDTYFAAKTLKAI